MQALTKKAEVKAALQRCTDAYHQSGIEACVQKMYTVILTKKIKFPLLEFCGHQLYNELPKEEHIIFCDQIEALKTIGGNVILGILLQNRLATNHEEAIEKAVEYISRADAWYVCDIIGERVFGHSLLHHTDKAVPKMKALAKHPSNWVVRSLGAGFHNAIKWGLPDNYVKQLFQILLTLANSKDKEIKQGTGWAAKTTAKFHPEIIAYFQKEIEDTKSVVNWFRTKVRIGLERNRHAKGN